MSDPFIVVIGMGADGPGGLAGEALDHIATARILAGGRRHLAFFEGWVGETIVIDADVDQLIRRLREVHLREKTVVLASGDPLFHGIGRALLKAFPREELIFLPHLSSIQLAFARIKETWDDARVVSLHGRPLRSILAPLEAREPKIAVLTDAVNHPGAIASLIVALGLGNDYEVCVCENLGGPDERVTRWPADAATGQSFSPLNVVILRRVRSEAGPALPLVGIPDEAIRHAPGSRGMITKREVRVIALAYLGLRPSDVLWDVGAGSGSIALEAGHLSPGLEVFAIERDHEAVQDVLGNVRGFGLAGIRVVEAEAPEAFSGLPDPDAVFVGGSGGRLREIVTEAIRRLRPGGRIVINCVTIENFSLGWEILNVHGLGPRATSVQLAHSGPVGRLHRLDPESPIFILRATKP